MSKLFLVRPDQIDDLRDRVEPFLVRACKRSFGRFLPENVLSYARSGEWQIWIVVDGQNVTAVCGTSITQYPSGLKALVLRFGSGRGVLRHVHNIEDVLDWGRAQGCGIVESAISEGWFRMLGRQGWKCTHRCVERSLG